MKELDVLLERFARSSLATAGSAERHILMRFLELPDPLLAAYLLGDAIPEEPDFAHLARSISGAARC